MENVCVFGAGSTSLDGAFLKEAYEMGRLLAQNGYGLVFGGGRTGLMGRVALGARENGAVSIKGIAPVFMDVPGVLYEDCDEMILTETMHERKQMMEAISDAFVVLPGGAGTFEEFFEVLTQKNLGLHKKAIVLLNTNGFFDPVTDLLEKMAAGHFMPKACLCAIKVAETAKEAISCLDHYEYQEVAPKWLTYKED
jgi:uncharacterized protein (TIGR00730 family)